MTWSPHGVDAPTHASAFRRYLVPGLVFQSVVIAGGYGTGRELVEFFLTRGPLSGLLGIGVTALVWSTVSMVSFELAATSSRGCSAVAGGSSRSATSRS